MDDLVNNYWETLVRKNVINISNNKFLKKPYLENYIITLSVILDNNKLINKILTLLDSNKITNEELFLFFYNNIEITDLKEKKDFELYFFNSNLNDKDFNKISIEIILYQIKYFRFYNTIIELLFDCNEEDNELYNFILIYIKNNKNEIKNYIKKNMKFNIFYKYIEDLYESFSNIVMFFLKLKLFTINYEKKDILNLFLKNLFVNWYNIYKKDILEEKVNTKIKDYIIKKNLLSRILCLPNV